MRRTANTPVTDCQHQFVTVYPQGWFGRGGTGTAKQHAAHGEGRQVDQHGNVVAVRDGKVFRGVSAQAVCGVWGDISGNPFTATEGNAITCSRCAAIVKREEVKQ